MLSAATGPRWCAVNRQRRDDGPDRVRRSCGADEVSMAATRVCGRITTSSRSAAGTASTSSRSSARPSPARTRLSGAAVSSDSSTMFGQQAGARTGRAARSVWLLLMERRPRACRRSRASSRVQHAVAEENGAAMRYCKVCNGRPFITRDVGPDVEGGACRVEVTTASRSVSASPSGS